MKMLLVFSIKSVSWEGRTSLPPSTQQPGACSMYWGHPLPRSPADLWQGRFSKGALSPLPLHLRHLSNRAGNNTAFTV